MLLHKLDDLFVGHPIMERVYALSHLIVRAAAPLEIKLIIRYPTFYSLR